MLGKQLLLIRVLFGNFIHIQFLNHLSIGLDYFVQIPTAIKTGSLGILKF